MNNAPTDKHYADAHIAQMTAEEKVGQLFLLAFAGNRLDQARTLFVDHGVGASYISNDNIPTPEAAAELTQRLQDFAAQTRLGLPLLLGVDQEGAWGVMVPRSATGPGNMALGATGDADAAESMYEVIGRELSAVGLNMLFAPCADCNSNPDNAAIGMRSFGESPGLVGKMTAGAVRGAMRGGVITSIKHFPGHGDTTLDSHRGLPTVKRSRAELDAIDLYPFAQGIAAGAEVVMTSHILYPALDAAQPATLSESILSQLLRNQLGFEGVILSDSMNMQAMRQHYGPARAEIAAIQAGVDLIMLAEEHYNHDARRYLDQQVAMLEVVIQAVRDGEIPAERIDDAVRQVLRLKARLGSARQQADIPRHAEQVGSAGNHAVELQVSRQAVAILRGGEYFQPLSAGMPLILVNATARSAYEPIDKTRGIGPNQSTPAFDHFLAALQQRTPNVTVFSAESVLSDIVLPEDVPVVAVTENYPLPGMDFDQSTQSSVIAALVAQGSSRVIVTALRDPYELAHFPLDITYLCAFSFRPSAAQAAAEVLFGEHVASGHSPVSVPGTGIKAIL